MEAAHEDGGSGMTGARTIGLLAGARPNYMKVFPLLRELERAPGAWRPVLIHSGQHYDAAMNDVFFEDFGARQPDHFLGVGSGSHGVQTGRVMIALEPVLAQERPDWLVVVGDVNSTVAGALTAVKMGIRVAHLEAGLRSGDRTMPEEINRLATDAMSDLLLTPSPDADDHLRREGAAPEEIVRVGNIMIDSLVHLLPKAKASPILSRLGLAEGGYVLVTLHRPSNVDDPARLAGLLEQLAAAAATRPVVFPMHPRTRKLVGASAALQRTADRLQCIDPLGYTDFLRLQTGAAAVLTDSGGIQEETTFLGIPCLTARRNTERPITVTQGTNRLVDPASKRLVEEIDQAIAEARGRPAPSIPLWDGRAAGRVVAALARVGSAA
jgi:UDP-N-acetylglucosamine 2-epimerase (non-hydrolysing)